MSRTWSLDKIVKKGSPGVEVTSDLLRVEGVSFSVRKVFNIRDNFVPRTTRSDVIGI